VRIVGGVLELDGRDADHLERLAQPGSGEGQDVLAVLFKY
jgi:hypothetical protein